MKNSPHTWMFAGLLLGLFTLEALYAEIPDELKIKREQVFEFAAKPTITRNGDKVTIAFTSKGLCDVTVAIEDERGRIIRHLASGLLGPNAPKPLQKNSRKQVVIWDGKNDKGKYVNTIDDVTVRVSLGLKPRFERTLFWSPKRRSSRDARNVMAVRARPEGVYVYDGGQAVDHIRLFSHGGEYIRTVHPFPENKLNDVKGLFRHTFPDGRRLPIKPSYQMCTFLTSGDNALNVVFKDGRYFLGGMDPSNKGKQGYGTRDMAIAGGRIAVGANRLNRLATDGGSAGLNVYGPWICFRNKKGIYRARESALTKSLGGFELLTHLKPHRFTFSPDGKTLYLTRYIQSYALTMHSPHNYWHHGVCRMTFEGDKDAEVFLGAAERGSDASHFDMPADVTCDGKGRIYVADMGNHRVQVFSPDGALLKTIPVEAPAQVAISPSGELYVFSWELLPNHRTRRVKVKKPYTLRRYKSADDPTLLATYDLPIADTLGLHGQIAEIDFWADPITIWISPGKSSSGKHRNRKLEANQGIQLLSLRDGKLTPLRNFGREAEKAVLLAGAPDDNRQLLYCNPASGDLYIGESRYDFEEVVRINPNTGLVKIVPLPFDVEDMCFDSDGHAYLRTYELVARYDPRTWREVPWDYGEERKKVTTPTSSLVRKDGKVASGVAMPVNIGWHHGGMHVAPSGKLVVGCLYRYKPQDVKFRGEQTLAQGKSYQPKLYPGRSVASAHGAGNYIHVWDRHGRLAYDDAVPGLGVVHGVGIDNEDSVYVLSSAPRVYNRQPPFNFLAGTLMKFRPKEGRILSDSPKAPVPLPASLRPKRDPELSRAPGNAWAENVDWMVGGIGWHGKNHGLGCGCRNTRFALDYFGRCFAPEVDRYSVVVVDTAGNKILRIGTYGNVDDGMPLVKDGGPPAPRSIGGDEVALMHAAYTAIHTDQRLFLADIGNYRILSVKLGYHAEQRVALKDVPDLKK